jgi:hypothetical protein
VSEDIEDINLIIDLEYDIKLVRLIGNTFVSSNINIQAEVIPHSDLDQEDFEIALSKCRFWLETIASRCVVFFRDNELALEMLIDENGKNRCSNYIMLTPFEPTDDHLAGLMQSKLTALANKTMTFGSVRIKSDNANGLVFRFVGDADDFLPPMSEWIGEYSYFDKPWWNRDDASTLDVVPPPDTDLTVLPSWAFKLDFLEQAIRAPQDVIVRPDFKPKIIKGGQDE